MKRGIFLIGFLFTLGANVLAAQLDLTRIAPELQASHLVSFLAKLKGEVPDSIYEWKQALKKDSSDFTEAVFPFSGCVTASSLQRPFRVLGRSREFILGFSTGRDGKEIEARFMSLGSNFTRTKFGRIKDVGKPTVAIEVAERADCRSCHRANGPIVWQRPSKNSLGSEGAARTHLGFAMLGRLLEVGLGDFDEKKSFFLERTKHYDSITGNLNTLATQELLSIKHKGVSLFASPSAKEFDQKMRQFYLWSYTQEILGALPESSRGAFSWGLVREALKAAIAPEKIEHLFNWYQKLDTTIKANQASLGVIASSNYIVLKSVRPGLDNPDLLKKIGLTQERADADPVQAYITLDEFLEKNPQTSVYADSQQPSSITAYVPFGVSFAADGVSFLETAMGFSLQEIATLKQQIENSGKSVGELVHHIEFLELETRSTFPSKKEVLDKLRGLLVR